MHASAAASTRLAAESLRTKLAAAKLRAAQHGSVSEGTAKPMDREAMAAYDAERRSKEVAESERLDIATRAILKELLLHPSTLLHTEAPLVESVPGSLRSTVRPVDREARSVVSGRVSTHLVSASLRAGAPSRLTKEESFAGVTLRPRSHSSTKGRSSPAAEKSSPHTPEKRAAPLRSTLQANVLPKATHGGTYGGLAANKPVKNTSAAAAVRVVQQATELSKELIDKRRAEIRQFMQDQKSSDRARVTQHGARREVVRSERRKRPTGIVAPHPAPKPQTLHRKPWEPKPWQAIIDTPLEEIYALQAVGPSPRKHSVSTSSHTNSKPTGVNMGRKSSALEPDLGAGGCPSPHLAERNDRPLLPERDDSPIRSSEVHHETAGAQPEEIAHLGNGRAAAYLGKEASRVPLSHSTYPDAITHGSNGAAHFSGLDPPKTVVPEHPLYAESTRVDALQARIMQLQAQLASLDEPLSKRASPSEEHAPSPTAEHSYSSNFSAESVSDAETEARADSAGSGNENMEPPVTTTHQHLRGAQAYVTRIPEYDEPLHSSEGVVGEEEEGLKTAANCTTQGGAQEMLPPQQLEPLTSSPPSALSTLGGGTLLDEPPAERNGVKVVFIAEEGTSHEISRPPELSDRPSATFEEIQADSPRKADPSGASPEVKPDVHSKDATGSLGGSSQQLLPTSPSRAMPDPMSFSTRSPDRSKLSNAQTQMDSFMQDLRHMAAVDITSHPNGVTNTSRPLSPAASAVTASVPVSENGQAIDSTLNSSRPKPLHAALVSLLTTPRCANTNPYRALHSKAATTEQGKSLTLNDKFSIRRAVLSYKVDKGVQMHHKEHDVEGGKSTPIMVEAFDPTSRVQLRQLSPTEPPQATGKSQPARLAKTNLTEWDVSPAVEAVEHIAGEPATSSSVDVPNTPQAEVISPIHFSRTTSVGTSPVADEPHGNTFQPSPALNLSHSAPLPHTKGSTKLKFSPEELYQQFCASMNLLDAAEEAESTLRNIRQANVEASAAQQVWLTTQKFEEEREAAALAAELASLAERAEHSVRERAEVIQLELEQVYSAHLQAQAEAAAVLAQEIALAQQHDQQVQTEMVQKQVPESPQWIGGPAIIKFDQEMQTETSDSASPVLVHKAGLPASAVPARFPVKVELQSASVTPVHFEAPAAPQEVEESATMYSEDFVDDGASTVDHTLMTRQATFAPVGAKPHVHDEASVADEASVGLDASSVEGIREMIEAASVRSMDSGSKSEQTGIMEDMMPNETAYSFDFVEGASHTDVSSSQLIAPQAPLTTETGRHVPDDGAGSLYKEFVRQLGERYAKEKSLLRVRGTAIKERTEKLLRELNKTQKPANSEKVPHERLLAAKRTEILLRHKAAMAALRRKAADVRAHYYQELIEFRSQMLDVSQTNQPSALLDESMAAPDMSMEPDLHSSQIASATRRSVAAAVDKSAVNELVSVMVETMRNMIQLESSRPLGATLKPGPTSTMQAERREPSLASVPSPAAASHYVQQPIDISTERSRYSESFESEEGINISSKESNRSAISSVSDSIQEEDAVATAVPNFGDDEPVVAVTRTNKVAVPAPPRNIDASTDSAYMLDSFEQSSSRVEHAPTLSPQLPSAHQGSVETITSTPGYFFTALEHAGQLPSDVTFVTTASVPTLWRTAAITPGPMPSTDYQATAATPITESVSKDKLVDAITDILLAELTRDALSHAVHVDSKDVLENSSESLSLDENSLDSSVRSRRDNGMFSAAEPVRPSITVSPTQNLQSPGDRSSPTRILNGGTALGATATAKSLSPRSPSTYGKDDLYLSPTGRAPAPSGSSPQSMSSSFEADEDIYDFEGAKQPITALAHMSTSSTASAAYNSNVSGKGKLRDEPRLVQNAWRETSHRYLQEVFAAVQPVVLTTAMARGQVPILPVEIYLLLERNRQTYGTGANVRATEETQIRHKLLFDGLNDELRRVARLHEISLRHFLDMLPGSTPTAQETAAEFALEFVTKVKAAVLQQFAFYGQQIHEDAMIVEGPAAEAKVELLARTETLHSLQVEEQLALPEHERVVYNLIADELAQDVLGQVLR